MFWLTGPIFDKELRVSSRRKRNYIVRFMYIALLTLAMVLIWLEEVRSGGNVSYRVSRMAQAGQIIVIVIVWFQFVATQLVAGVMLSTAISDEIYHKTLGTLMTTPISSFQIVMGKLLSKLLQTILLIGISFPLLSIVRVFGGIPWNYVISSLSITMVTVIFVGSLSLFYSIFTRRAYVSLIMTILTLAGLFLLTPFLVAMIIDFAGGRFNDREFFSVFNHINPYVTMAYNTAFLDSPRGMRGYYFNWPIACGIMLAASAVLIAFSVALVRRVALRQATGQVGIFSGKNKKSKKRELAETGIRPSGKSSIRRVGRLPVLWKETRVSIFGKRKVLFIIAIALSLLLILGVYAYAANDNALDDDGFHIFMTIIYFSIGFLFTVVLPANCIASEKESRSWHLLLATTLSSGEIAVGKFIGAIRRCLLSWSYLFAHIIIFTIFGFIHPLGILQMFMVVSGTSMLLIGSGLLFSTIFKRTTTAVIMNFIFAALIWAGIPLLIAIIGGIGRFHNWGDFVEGYCNAIPFLQAGMAMEITANGLNLQNAYWPTGQMTPSESTMTILTFATIYAILGILLTMMAKCRFRKKIF